MIGIEAGQQPNRRAITLVLAFAFAMVAVLLALKIAWIPVRQSFNSNEGWNAYHAMRAVGEGVLYPVKGSYLSANYTPLSFYLLGYLGKLFGDMIIIGRVLSIASLLYVAASAAVLVRRVGVVFPGMQVALLLILGINASAFWQYVAMNEPQWLGHAVMMTGLLVLVPRDANKVPGTTRILIAMLVMLAGGLVKQNLIAFPVAVTLWLLWLDRRAFWTWAISGGVAGLAALAVLHLSYGQGFWDNMRVFREMSLWMMVTKVPLILALIVPSFVLTMRLWKRRGEDSRLVLFLLLALVAVPLGIFQRSGYGVSLNAHYDSLVALAMGAGLAITRRDVELAFRPSRPLFWVVAPLMIALPVFAGVVISELPNRGAVTARWSGWIERARQADGPVACRDLAVCYWAGKPAQIEFWTYNQYLKETGDTSRLIADLKAEKWAGIEVRKKDMLFGDDCKQAKELQEIMGCLYHPVFAEERQFVWLVPPSSPEARTETVDDPKPAIPTFF